MKSQPLILIGGIDPGAQAGLFADARVAERLRTPYRVIPTALTSQSDQKMWGWEATSPKLFSSMLASLPKKVRGIKIGMLGKKTHLKLVLEWIQSLSDPLVIWDPVRESSSGGSLLEIPKWNLNLEKLWHHCTLITPNFPEAQWILKMDLGQASSKLSAVLDGLQDKIQHPHTHVLLKGGHLSPRSPVVQDTLISHRGTWTFQHPRIKGKVRGTGCTLATALAIYLSRGHSLNRAYRLAHGYLKKHLF